MARYSIIGLTTAAALFLSAGGSWAQRANDYPVAICHKPGTPAERTIVVDDNAVPAHLNHGDSVGVCSGNDLGNDSGNDSGGGSGGYSSETPGGDSRGSSGGGLR